MRSTHKEVVMGSQFKVLNELFEKDNDESIVMNNVTNERIIESVQMGQKRENKDTRRRGEKDISKGLKQKVTNSDILNWPL